MVPAGDLAAYLKIDATDVEAMALVQRLASAATIRVAQWLNRIIYDPASPPVPLPTGAIPATDDIRLAIMTLVSMAHDERLGSAHEDAELGMPATVISLIGHYRRFHEPPVTAGEII